MAQNNIVTIEHLSKVYTERQIFQNTDFSINEGEKVALYAKLLLDQALLVSGMPVDDPVAFAENVCALM